MSRTKDERGQILVMTVIAMTVLLGMTAFVLDAGAWFRSKRQLQATADAAALAGAQALPDDPGTASNLALQYADKNGGGVLGADVTVTSTNGANDTISVGGKKTEPGFFSRIFGIDTVDVRASAKARVGIPKSVKYAAPMVVSCDHEYVKNCNDSNKLPDFNQLTTLKYDPMGAPGAFGMLNLDGGSGTPGTSKEAAWILHGFEAYLDSNKYYRSDPGAKFSSNEVQSALDARIGDGKELLFPVFSTLDGQGQNAQYFVIGWIGFHLVSYKAEGNNATLTGWFTTYTAQGILTSSGQGGPNYGVKSIQLIG